MIGSLTSHAICFGEADSCNYPTKYKNKCVNIVFFFFWVKNIVIHEYSNSYPVPTAQSSSDILDLLKLLSDRVKVRINMI